jgi:hypothetical protein
MGAGNVTESQKPCDTLTNLGRATPTVLKPNIGIVWIVLRVTHNTGVDTKAVGGVVAGET